MTIECKMRLIKDDPVKKESKREGIVERGKFTLEGWDKDNSVAWTLRLQCEDRSDLPSAYQKLIGMKIGDESTLILSKQGVKQEEL